MSNGKLSFREKLGYGAGDLGNNFMFDMGQFYLLFFYTNFMQIPAWIGGTVFLTAKLVDAFIDTAIGAWADSRQMGSRGKFRPFILYGTLPLAITTTMCFIVPNFDQTGRIVWAFASYIIFNAFYSVVTVQRHAERPCLVRQVGYQTIILYSCIIIYKGALYMYCKAPPINFQ